jgi:hypothetical protein
MNRKPIALEIFQAKIGDVHLETVLTTLDRLHDAAAQQAIESETNLETKQLIGWLEDIIFTAQEALKELQDSDASHDTANSSGSDTVIRLYRQG